MERIPMLAADERGIARAIVAAQAVESALHGPGHEVEVGFELTRAGSVSGPLDVQPFGRITRIA
ncbi:MAG: hypothetical protein M3O70_22725 [Actinomycetota bacterium]|nr:hypothetical protein [Actinomycetota bacterium]